MAFKFNPITGKLDLVGSASDPYITVGTSGITTIRWQSIDDGSLWDMVVRSTGVVDTIPVVVSTSFLLLENGSYILLETGDKLILE